MSDETRSVKRRKITSDHEPTPSTVIANGDTHQNASSRTAAERADKGLQKRANSTSQTYGISKNNETEYNTIATNNEDQSEDPSANDSDDEPRRSGRQRKPSAKLLSMKNEVTQPATPSEPRATPKSRARARKTINEKENQSTTLSSETPAKKFKSVKSTPSQTPKRANGQLPSNAASAEPITAEKTPPLFDPIETPKKRGRPPGSAKKQNDGQKLKETPKILRFDVAVKEAHAKSQGTNGAQPVVDDEIFSRNHAVTQEQQAVIEGILPKLRNHKFTLRPISRIVLEKLAQRRPTPLTHLQGEYTKVYTLLESTVTAGEGNSMVIVGARGSGKTTLVHKALAELGKTQKEFFHVVRLNGFIQTDDKLALREIWRQLGREMDIDEDVSKSYADTLTMLLALLSHPDEIAGEETDHNQVAKSVIIIMDEFDLFATHARQTLLYNLLDIAQSRKAPIAVLGLTTKFDVTERLEKRVKSRFSHRYVHLPLAKSLRVFQDICKAALTILPDELSFDEQVSLSQTQDSGTKHEKQSSFLSDVLALWNASVSILFLNNDFERAYLRDIFHLTKSVPAVLTSLLLPLSALPQFDIQSSSSILPVKHFLTHKTQQSLQPPVSSLLIVLPSLSELQLSLLIAAARLDIIHDTDTCSFGMAYAHYVELASKARLHSAAAGALAAGAGARVWGRDVARGEWEILLTKNLLLPVSESGGVATVASPGSLVRTDVRLEEISGALKGMSAVMERWCKQI